MDLYTETFITERIPHRPPFLWLDRVLEISAESIIAEKKIPANLDLFQGHYPGHPLMPGVLLCEAVFQAGALLIGEMVKREQDSSDGTVHRGMPVLTRILGARFKREVLPGDTVTVSAALKEKVGPAWFMKGTVRVKGKVAVRVEFACALKSSG
jgi:3-hydroxyacyl-[acyl-carrier-protein] dehydratase